jgi:hypothetical protein
MYHINEDSKGTENIYGFSNKFLNAGTQYSFKKVVDIGLFNIWVSRNNEFNVPFPNANLSTTDNYATLKLSFNLTKMLRFTKIQELLLDHTGIIFLMPKFITPNIAIN